VIDGQRELASHSEPSLLQAAKGTAVTIQFQPGNNGVTPNGGTFQKSLAGQPKQAATHIHPVKVGVTNKRK
jgi:hypothetical protein